MTKITVDDDDVRSGTEQAMAQLNGVHAVKIAWGEYLAVKLAKKHLSVHSRALREAMVKEGIIPEDNPGKEFWLGAVFRNLRDKGIMEKNGTYKYGDKERNTHERTISIWQLKAGADLTPYAVAPPKEEKKDG